MIGEWEAIRSSEKFSERKDGWAVAAFYTIGTMYEDEIKILERSLQAYDLDYVFLGFPPRNSWEENCGIKPEFLKLVLEMAPGVDIVYVDADAEIKAHPVIFDQLNKDPKINIGVHYRNGKELLSGTIYLKNTEFTMEIIDLWIKEQEATPRQWDQKTLAKVLDISSGEFIYKLPPTYCQIFDLMRNEGGSPVILHNQASRRAKQMMRAAADFGRFPNLGIRIIHNADNSISIPRNHREAEKYLDQHYIRVTNELRWFPKAAAGKRTDDLETIFKGQHCYIVGKGPSLDFLSERHFPEPGPVIAINEAIHKVEKTRITNPLFAMQQDMALKNSCRPGRGSIIVAQQAKHWYADFDKKFIFTKEELGVMTSNITVVYAIALAQKLGAKNFTLIAFDSCTNKSTAYAKCIGYDSSAGGDVTRFLKHRQVIEKQLGKSPVTWITPALIYLQ